MLHLESKIIWLFRDVNDGFIAVQVLAGSTVVVDLNSDDFVTVGALQQQLETVTGISANEQHLIFQGQHVAHTDSILAAGEAVIGDESTLSLVMEGHGGASVAADAGNPMDAAWGDVCSLRRCMHRIHRFSPGVEGRALVGDGNRCASLGHWSLINGHHIDRSTVSPSALHAACHAGRLDAVESLLSDDGLDVTASDAGGWTALHYAVIGGHDDVVQRLFALTGEDLATNDGVHASALRTDLWRRVTHRGAAAVVDAWDPPSSSQEAVGQLVQMITEGDVASEVLCRRVCSAVDMLGTTVLQEVDTERRDIAGWSSMSTVLCAAAGTGRYSLCLLSIGLGANVELAAELGMTPLWIASCNGQTECARLFLERGANVNMANTWGATPLLVACERGEVDCARLLVDWGAELDKADEDGATPLWIACRSGELDCACLLVDRGADVDMANTDLVTPLYVACEEDQLDCAVLLLHHGAMVDKATVNGKTPLHIACRNGRLDCTRLLLDRCAEVEQGTQNGTTPLYVACEEGELDCARLLLDRGAKVNKATDEGVIPLHVACGNGRRHVAALLLERGADVSKCTNSGASPADFASSGDVFSDPDSEMAEAMELAIRDRAAAIQLLWGMDAQGPQ